MNKREIKFRTFGESGPMWYSKDANSLEHFFAIAEFNTMPVEQFTGHQDKNGREIYDGDVVMHYGGSPKIPDRRYVVEWHENVSGFLLVDKAKTKQQTWWRDGSWLWRVSKYLEVIGNIHENPELLP